MNRCCNRGFKLFKYKQETLESMQAMQGISITGRNQNFIWSRCLMCLQHCPWNSSMTRKSLNPDNSQPFCDNSAWIGWMHVRMSHIRVLYEKCKLDCETSADARSWPWSDRRNHFLGGAWLLLWWLALEASQGPHWAPGPDACNGLWVSSCVGSTATTDT